MRTGCSESAPPSEPVPTVLAETAVPGDGVSGASGGVAAGTRAESTEPAELASVGARHELYMRRSFAVASAVASMTLLFAVWYAFAEEISTAPTVALAGYGVMVVMPVVVAIVVLSTVLAERRGWFAVVAVLDQVWRVLALVSLLWYLGFGLALATWRTQMADSQAFLTATSPMTYLIVVWGLLAVSVLPPYWGAKGVLLLTPLQLALNADPGGVLSSSDLIATGYHCAQGAMVIGALEWLRGRARHLDQSERDRGAEELVLARERAATLARRRAEDFIHDDILSALVPVATGSVRGEPVRRAAERALRVLEGTEGEVVPSSAAELVAALRAEAAAQEVPVEVEGRLEADVPLPENVMAALVRAAREALRNSVRHADPDGRGVRRAVLVEVDDVGLRVVVEDEGVGFDAASVVARHGLINSITRCAADAGIDIELRTAVGQGTVLTLSWRKVDAGGHAEPVERLLESRGARVVAGLLIVFHGVSTVVHWHAYTTPWVSPLCFLALLVCSYLVLRSWEGRMAAWAAWLVVGTVAFADAAQFAVLVSRPMPGWDHWTTGAAEMLACGLLTRGRAVQAWAAMTAVAVGTLVWMVDTGGGLALGLMYCSGHVVVLAVWQGLIAWAQRAHRALGVQEAWMRAVRRQQWVEGETRRVMAVTREHVARRARPVLERIAVSGQADDALVLEALVLEAELRDEIRAACFTGTAVPVVAGRARRRGVEVVLFDDSGGGLGCSELDRVVRAVVGVLEGCWSGRVVVRVPPVSRREVVVATHDGRTVLRLER